MPGGPWHPELVGAVLFVVDVALGAKMLMLFILLVTPVMHPFWRGLQHAAPVAPQPDCVHIVYRYTLAASSPLA